MPKKTTKTKTKKTRSQSRARSNASIVTSKTSDTEIKRALARRLTRQTRTELIDHAVPEAFLFQGMLGRYAQVDKPFIEHGDHTFSPFILSLKQTLQTPNELLTEQARPFLSVNFLEDHFARETIMNSAPDLANDLILTTPELESQMTEGVLARHRWSTWSLPLTSRLEIPPLAMIGMKQVHHALKYETTAFEHITSDAFVPHAVPEDIFAYFDFPENENPEEADIVSLEELEEDFEEELHTAPRLHNPWRFPSFDFGWQRAIASFVGLSFLFVLPLHAMNVVQDLRGAKAELEQTGSEAVSLLSAGAQAALTRNAGQAGSDFNKASDRFQTARETLDRLGAGADLLLSVLPVAQDSYKSGQALVTAGHELSIAGGRLSAGYTAIESELSPTPISRLNILEVYLTSTVPHLEAAASALSDVDMETVPEEYRDTLLTVQTSLPALIETINEFETFYALAKELLGATGTKRYLIIFQNNTEIRPTGGFIGSFAEVKVHNGVIENLNVPGGGSYDLQGSLKENLIAPGPLQILSARWEFQDGNWFPDFPTSARQLMQFYQDAGGPSVDGVLAVNATFVSDLIGLLGPIEMEEYGRTINQENFIFEAQRIVEYEYDKEENTPKAFIGDLAPKLVERTIEKTSNDFLGVIDYLNTGLSQKDLQLYLANETLQREVIAQGWGGELKWTDGDFLMVVDSNLGGGKTDGVIQEHVDLHVAIAEDGTITNTVTISRTHYGIQGLLFTGVNNVDYLRVYAPKGSTLLEAQGFSIPDRSLFNIPDEDWVIDDDLAYGLLTQEVDPVSGTMISEELGKAVFGNWVQTKPGTTSVVTLRYTLPFKMETSEEKSGLFAALKAFAGFPNTQEYTLTLQKQSGIMDRTTRVRVTIPDQLNPLWSSDSLETEFTNHTDQLFAILFESL
ncbi:DUF4012 domain-containing protein [Candidatus Uhrbacteria bacterium]|nr:DUF4012 domain-containing protein [Candidatus Uhrbacteria bacterium]